SGASSPTGDVHYYVTKGDNTCATNGATDLGDKNMSGGVVPPSNTFTFPSAGTFYFWAVYSGDNNNNGKTSGCSTETVVVDLNSPDATTAQNFLPNDSATLSGSTSSAGGTLTFSLFGPFDATCSGT